MERRPRRKSRAKRGVDEALGGSGEVDWHGRETEAAMRLRLLGASERLLERTLTAFEEDELYDASGNVVAELYTRSGRPVSMRGLRPRTFREATSALAASAQVSGFQLAALAELSEADARHDELLTQFAARVIGALGETLTDDQRERLRMAVGGGRSLPEGSKEGGDGLELIEGVFGEGEDDDDE